MSLPPEVSATLAQFELHQLLAFDALVAAGSVTAAAKRLGVTQSAVSHTLRRLREQLDDPLFVRVGARLVPTPRAEALHSPVHAALVTLGHALAAPDGFVAATTRRAFRVSAPDLFDALLLPALLARLTRDAPGADLVLLAPRARPERELEAGDIDVAVLPTGIRPAGSSPDPWSPSGAGDLVRTVLFDDTYRCFLRAGHPDLPALDLERFLALSHVLVSPTGAGGGVVDEVLAARGLSRRVAVRLPGFALAPRVVAETDHVLTAPASLELALGGAAVEAVDPPLALPGHSLTLVWHRRHAADPAHRWLRDQIRAVVQERSPGAGRIR